MSSLSSGFTGQSSTTGSSWTDPGFRQNPFLSETDPAKWDLWKIAKDIERLHPLKAVQEITNEVKQYLVEVEVRGTNVQVKKAQEMINNWQNVSRALKFDTKRKSFQKRKHGAASSAGVSIGQITGTVIINYSAQLPENSSDDNSSINSVEEHHNKMCRVYVQGSYVAEEGMDKQTELARKWIVQGEDMTAHLSEYRRKCIKLAHSKRHLSYRHLLALSFIYLISPTNRCAITSLHPFQQQAVFEDLSQSLPLVPKDVWEFCRNARHAATRNQNVESFLRTEYSAQQGNDVEMLNCIQILYTLNGVLPANDRHPIESEITVSTIKAFIPSSLYVDGAKDEWQTYHMPYVDCSTGRSISLKPDYVMYVEPTAKTNLELFFLEVKDWPNKGNVYEADTVKLGKEMKLGLHKLVNGGVKDPITVGMLVEGCHVKTYYMDLKFDGLYRMVETSLFNLPTNRGDELLLVPPVLERLKQMKVIIERTMNNIHTAMDPARPKTSSGI
ncbi:uncharacterized protein BYT42DRAFT_604214 [Radiomyces spectabilis]|uniref:uncharacterized protein n=1 Tax=Radiomyces spectabilis TaxID=64574 RepID=UPI0022203E7D|nr:uncharacterized protein BYT42DRAFT_604214 [Radiomyces spectabilis]KAI8381206.1 hypothetical protein BYT42DRAFT_604214 [Radiomyces spectabilis]